eukprot:2062061-Amphidinium_carterae.2
MSTRRMVVGSGSPVKNAVPATGSLHRKTSQGALDNVMRSVSARYYCCWIYRELTKEHPPQRHLSSDGPVQLFVHLCPGRRSPKRLRVLRASTIKLATERDLWGECLCHIFLLPLRSGRQAACGSGCRGCTSSIHMSVAVCVVGVLEKVAEGAKIFVINIVASGCGGCTDGG